MDTDPEIGDKYVPVVEFADFPETDRAFQELLNREIKAKIFFGPRSEYLISVPSDQVLDAVSTLMLFGVPEDLLL